MENGVIVVQYAGDAIELLKKGYTVKDTKLNKHGFLRFYFNKEKNILDDYFEIKKQRQQK